MCSSDLRKLRDAAEYQTIIEELRQANCGPALEQLELMAGGVGNILSSDPARDNLCLGLIHELSSRLTRHVYEESGDRLVPSTLEEIGNFTNSIDTS